MKRYILTIAIVTLTSSTLFSQTIKDVGAGVIDFLLRNPKTANKMNVTETVALDIIGDLLKKESERKHQLEYANAGRNQITINSNDGRQAQFVRNEQGRIFLLVDGIVYPIAQELVNEASGYKSPPIQSYAGSEAINSSKIENWINNPEIIHYKESYTVEVGGEYLNRISYKTGTPIDYIGDGNYNTLPKKYRENTVKIPAYKNLIIAKAYYKNSVCNPITFKWARDLDGSGTMSFDEFKQIKTSFYDNENFIIGIFYSTDKYAKGNLIIELFDDYTGDLIKQDIKTAKINHRGIEYLNISSNELPIGSYTINAKLVDNSSQSLASNNSNFEIIQGNSSTREISNLEKSVREKISNSTPEGIFFYNSWKDLNNNNKYDYNEFSGLNKPSYNLTKEVLYIGINLPNKYGEIIIQSFTKDGRLLGTTTESYQRISGHWAGLGSDPLTSMDFIDMIQISGVGEYKITVSFVEGGKYEQKLLITE